MSKQWPEYLCQVWLSHRTASFLILVALKAPPLLYIPAIMPAAEVSAGVCARPEPRCGLSASPLTHGANLCLQTQAQWNWEWGELSSRVNFLWSKGGFWGFILQAAYHLHVSVPGWYWIVEMSEITEVDRIMRSLSKAKQNRVVALCQNALGTDFIRLSAKPIWKIKVGVTTRSDTKP